MTDNSYNNWTELSDSAVEEGIGQYVKQMRHQQNKTQAELAKEANISRSTLSLLERGDAGSITTLIKILRVLNQLHTFKVFEVQKKVSPLALAKLEQKTKQRVRNKKSIKDNIPSW